MNYLEEAYSIQEKINKNVILRHRLYAIMLPLLIVGALLASILMSVYFLRGDYPVIYLMFAIVGSALFAGGFSIGIYVAILGTKNDKLKAQRSIIVSELEKERLRSL